MMALLRTLAAIQCILSFTVVFILCMYEHNSIAGYYSMMFDMLDFNWPGFLLSSKRPPGHSHTMITGVNTVTVGPPSTLPQAGR